jgi:hypothetical protein
LITKEENEKIFKFEIDRLETEFKDANKTIDILADELDI